MKIEFPVYHDRTLNVVKTEVNKDPMKPDITRDIDNLKNTRWFVYPGSSKTSTAAYYGDPRGTF